MESLRRCKEVMFISETAREAVGGAHSSGMLKHCLRWTVGGKQVQIGIQATPRDSGSRKPHIYI